MYISDEDFRFVSQLWCELAEFPAGQSDAALTHCFEGLARIIGAGNVFWVGAVREGGDPQADDALRGWRPKAPRHLHADPARDRLVADILRRMKKNIVDPQTQALVASAGVTRAFLQAELVDDESWEKSSIVNETMRSMGIEHRMIGAHAMNPRAESYIGLDRGPGEAPFGERERDLLHLFLLGCPGFHREQLLARGLARPPLSPREQDVLGLLLTDLDERAIAYALGLTWRTTHQYVVSILKKFGVKGRRGLMAYWLRHNANGRP